MRYIYSLIAMLLWITGIVVCKGFWATAAAIFVPFVGWYFTIQWLIERFA